MKKWLFRIIWIPVFVLTVLFFTANRQLVSISLDPVNASSPAVTTPALPLWFWLMTMLFLGLAAGAMGSWLSGRPSRMKHRAEHREIKALRREIADLRGRISDADPFEPEEPEPPLLESAETDR